MIKGLSGEFVYPSFPFADQFNIVGQNRNLPPKLLAAIGWRETLCFMSPIDAQFVISGDGGHGIMQLTSSWPKNWPDPRTNIDYAALTFVEPAWAYWTSLGYTGEPLVKLVAASYNEGLEAAKRYHAEGNVDIGTTNGYGEAVLEKFLEMCDTKPVVSEKITITPHPATPVPAAKPAAVKVADASSPTTIHPKVAAATLAGAVVILLSTILTSRGIIISGDATAAITTILSFVFGYITPSTTGE